MRFYIGQTRNLSRRLKQHQDGLTKSTAGLEPVLVWYNTVRTRRQAVALELQLKNSIEEDIRSMIKQFRNAMNGALPNFLNIADVDALVAEIVGLRREIVGVRQETRLLRRFLLLAGIGISGWIFLGLFFLDSL